MDTLSQPGKQTVLIVSDADDASVRDCADALAKAGMAVEFAGDVYTAMAQLVRGKPLEKVLLDIRSLDDKEMAFLRLAHRYHPAVDVVVPDLKGTAERIAAYGPGVRSVAIPAIVESVTLAHGRQTSQDPSRARPAETGPADPSAGSQTPAPWSAPLEAPALGASTVGPLSTDGGPEAAGDGPSLHEAVRARMGASEPKKVRRSPPPRASDTQPAPIRQEPASVTPPSAPQVPSPPPSGEATLSPEEMDALLMEGEPSGGEAAGSTGEGRPDPSTGTGP